MAKTKQAPLNLATLTCELMHGQVSARSAEWLLRGLHKYIRTRGRLSLDQALGLAMSGSSHVSTQLALIFRDQYLAAAVELISLDLDVSTWQRCQRLAVGAGRIIPCWEAHPAMIDTNTMQGWERSLYHAWAMGQGMPGTAHGILAAINRNAGSSIKTDHLKMLETTLKAIKHEDMVQYQSQRR